MLSAAWPGRADIPPKPGPGEFFHDLANAIDEEDAQEIRSLQQSTFQQAGVPIVVVTVNRMQAYDPGSPSIESFARRWFDTWGIGGQAKNDGILVIITTGDRERLSQRIIKLEERTDAEVVCAVSTESGRYDRAESFSGLCVGLLALAVGNKLFVMAKWDASASVSLGWQVTLIVLGFVAGSLLASYWHPLRRLFVTKSEMRTEVLRRAHQVFSQHGVGDTLHRGGLLIYLSLFERQLEIRADRPVAEKLSQEGLEAVRDAVLAKLREGHMTDGLVAGLDKSEALLAEALPSTGKDTSALSNEVLLFHPRP